MVNSKQPGHIVTLIILDNPLLLHGACIISSPHENSVNMSDKIKYISTVSFKQNPFRGTNQLLKENPI